jgi:hypothetical protein
MVLNLGARIKERGEKLKQSDSKENNRAGSNFTHHLTVPVFLASSAMKRLVLEARVAEGATMKEEATAKRARSCIRTFMMMLLMGRL